MEITSCELFLTQSARLKITSARPRANYLPCLTSLDLRELGRFLIALLLKLSRSRGQKTSATAFVGNGRLSDLAALSKVL